MVQKSCDLQEHSGFFCKGEAFTRRAFLHTAGLGLCAGWLGCSRSPAPDPPANTPPVQTASAPSLHPQTVATRPKDVAPKPPKQGEHRWDLLTFPNTPVGREEALVLTPWDLEESPPVLIALHGRSETRSIQAGARGWRDDYQLTQAHRDLVAQSVTSKTFRDLIHPKRLAEIQRSLMQPYKGVKLACPFTPDLMARGVDKSARGARPFGRFLKHHLLPRIANTPPDALPPRKRVGIDGISLGGRVALLVGLSFPEVFGAVGGMQPAFQTSEIPYLTKLAVNARKRHPPHILRLVTSERDPFRRFVLAWSKSLVSAGVEHDVLVTPGPHDYIWNQGPGSAEMLLWYDRVLRGGYGVGGNIRSYTEL